MSTLHTIVDADFIAATLQIYEEIRIRNNAFETFQKQTLQHLPFEIPQPDILKMIRGKFGQSEEDNFANELLQKYGTCFFPDFNLLKTQISEFANVLSMENKTIENVPLSTLVEYTFGGIFRVTAEFVQIYLERGELKFIEERKQEILNS